MTRSLRQGIVFIVPHILWHGAMSENGLYCVTHSITRSLRQGIVFILPHILWHVAYGREWSLFCHTFCDTWLTAGNGLYFATHSVTQSVRQGNGLYCATHSMTRGLRQGNGLYCATHSMTRGLRQGIVFILPHILWHVAYGRPRPLLCRTFYDTEVSWAMLGTYNWKLSSSYYIFCNMGFRFWSLDWRHTPWVVLRILLWIYFIHGVNGRGYPKLCYM
jgi:hypothetical protein